MSTSKKKPAKPARGRPPLPEAERRSVRVEVRLTEAEYLLLLEQVDEDMPNVSEVLRQKALT
jgi:hypothetical protein